MATLIERIRPLSWSVLRALTGLQPEVPQPLPAPEQQILAVVPHTSHLDTLALLFALSGRAHELSIVVKGSYWQERFAYHALLSLVAPDFIAVENGKPKENFQKMIAALESARQEKRNCLLGIFPQGTRQREHPLESGYAWLSVHTGVPVTPVVIERMPAAFSSGDLSPLDVLKFSIAQYLHKGSEQPVRVSFLEPVLPPENTHSKKAKEQVIFEYTARLKNHDWSDEPPACVLESSQE